MRARVSPDGPCCLSRRPASALPCHWRRATTSSRADGRHSAMLKKPEQLFNSLLQVRPASSDAADHERLLVLQRAPHDCPLPDAVNERTDRAVRVYSCSPQKQNGITSVYQNRVELRTDHGVTESRERATRGSSLVTKDHVPAPQIRTTWQCLRDGWRGPDTAPYTRRVEQACGRFPMLTTCR